MVLGIGNCGDEYEGTRHNVGFDLIDRVAATEGWTWQRGRGPVREARGMIDGISVALIKPWSYVNRSGEALRGWDGGAIPADRPLLVLVDDLALPVGSLRLRAKGRHGGHNGLRSLSAALGGDDFARLRLGIGEPPPGQIVEHVLGRFDEADRTVIDGVIEKAIEPVRAWLRGDGIDALQNTINRASLPADVRETGTAEDAARAAPQAPTARDGGESDGG